MQGLQIQLDYMTFRSRGWEMIAHEKQHNPVDWNNAVLLEPSEVASTMKISLKALNKLVREGKLRCVQVTVRVRRFTPEQVQQYIESRSTEIRFDKKASPTVSSGPRKGGEKSKSVGVSGKDLREEMKKWR
jgi:excisionase family DNA binding protein